MLAHILYNNFVGKLGIHRSFVVFQTAKIRIPFCFPIYQQVDGRLPVFHGKGDANEIDVVRGIAQFVYYYCRPVRFLGDHILGDVRLDHSTINADDLSIHVSCIF